MFTVIDEISKAVIAAKKKHPDFTNSEVGAVMLALEELGETAQALNDNDKVKARAEVLDTIAVLVRYLETFNNTENEFDKIENEVNNFILQIEKEIYEHFAKYNKTLGTLPSDWKIELTELIKNLK